MNSNHKLAICGVKQLTQHKPVAIPQVLQVRRQISRPKPALVSHELEALGSRRTSRLQQASPDECYPGRASCELSEDGRSVGPSRASSVQFIHADERHESQSFHATSGNDQILIDDEEYGHGGLFRNSTPDGDDLLSRIETLRHTTQRTKSRSRNRLCLSVDDGIRKKKKRKTRRYAGSSSRYEHGRLVLPPPTMDWSVLDIDGGGNGAGLLLSIGDLFGRSQDRSASDYLEPTGDLCSAKEINDSGTACQPGDNRSDDGSRRDLPTQITQSSFNGNQDGVGQRIGCGSHVLDGELSRICEFYGKKTDELIRQVRDMIQDRVTPMSLIEQFTEIFDQLHHLPENIARFVESKTINIEQVTDATRAGSQAGTASLLARITEILNHQCSLDRQLSCLRREQQRDRAELVTQLRSFPDAIADQVLKTTSRQDGTYTQMIDRMMQLQTSVKVFEDEYRKLSGSHEHLRAIAEAEVTDRDSTIQQLNETIQTHNDATSTWQIQYTALASEVAQHEARIEHLRAAAEAEVRGRDTTIGELNHIIQTQKDASDVWHTQYDALSSEAAQREACIAHLRAVADAEAETHGSTIQRLERTIEEHKDAINTWQVRYTQVASEVERCKALIDEMSREGQDSFKKMDAEISQRDARITSLSDVYNKFKDTHEQLKAHIAEGGWSLQQKDQELLGLQEANQQWAAKYKELSNATEMSRASQAFFDEELNRRDTIIKAKDEELKTSDQALDSQQRAHKELREQYERLLAIKNSIDQGIRSRDAAIGRGVDDSVSALTNTVLWRWDGVERGL